MNLSLFPNFRLFFLFFFLYRLTLSALTFMPAEQQWIDEHPVIKMGADHSWPPYDFVDSSGRHVGIAADILTLIEKKSGLIFDVRPGIWSEVMTQMKTGGLDGLTCAVKTSDREDSLRFTTPYVSMPLAIVVKEGRQDIYTVDDLDGKVVAVNSGSYLHEWLVSHYPDIQLYLTSSNNASVEAVSFSHADAYVGNIAVANYIIKTKYLSNLKIVNKIPDMTTDVSVAISKENALLYSIIEKTLADISQDERNKITQRWSLLSQTELEQSAVLSSPERQWIVEHGTVSVGAGPDWAPFDFVDEQGEYAGIANDYLTLLTQKTGLKFDVIVDQWSNTLQKMKDKKIDLLHAVYYTDERSQYMDYSRPYFEMLDYFFIRDDLDVKSLTDLNGKRVAMPKDFAHIEILKREFPLIEIITVETFSDTIDAVLEGRADMLFDTYVSLTHILQKEGIDTIVPFKSYRGRGTVKLHMSTAKEEPLLASIINKGLESISSVEKKEIYTRWIGHGPVVEQERIELTRGEEKWIEEHPVLTYSETDWSPMSIIKDGEMLGILREYLDKVTERSGLIFKYIPSSSWPDVLRDFKKGVIDFVPGVGKNTHGSSLGLTSRTFASFPFVLVTRHEESFINDIDELEEMGKTIAVPSSWSSHNYLVTQRPNIEIIETADAFEALELVKEGKAYAFLGHMAVAMHHVGTYYPNELHIAGKIDFDFDHQFLLQKEDTVLLSILNKVIDSISEQEQIAIRNRWIEVNVKEAQDLTFLWKYLFLVLFVFALFIYWNRRLSREVVRRKRIEDALLVEKENFKVLFEKVSDGNLIIQQGRFIAGNEAALKMVGLDDISTLLESRPEDWSPPFQSDGLASDKKSDEMIDRCLKTGEHRFEWIHQDIDGNEFWVDVGLTRISYQGDEAIYVVWRDISEQKLLEKSLKQSESQIRMILDHIPLLVIVTSHEGKILMANPQALNKYGFTPKVLSEVNILEYYADPEARNIILQTLQTYGKVEQKIVKFKIDGVIHAMMLSILPIEYGQQTALLSIAVDMTERLKMEDALIDAKDAADMANRSKSEFLANMSHEIRTPMNAIIGFTELLNDQLKEPRLKSYVKTIQSAGNTLLTLINDILDLSKIEAGKMEIDKRPTDLFALSEEVGAIFMMSVRSKGLDLIVDVDDATPNSLLIDDVRLRQVLLNLIGNAVKFTDQGIIRLKIELLKNDAHHSKVDLEIKIEDSGIGIPPEQLEHIFKDFVQREGQDNRKFGGTGLGLSISKRLCEMMGGEISVESLEGKGTTFCVRLPEVDIASVQREKQSKETSMIDAHAIAFRAAKIMVVDDIADNRDLIVDIFEDSALGVVTAADGLEAIRAYKVHKPDLILMDIRMPKMDGYTAASEIKKIADVPIVALTASVMKDDHERLKREDFDGYLRKPVLRDELFLALSRFLKYDDIISVHDHKSSIELSYKAKANLALIIKTMSEEITPVQVSALKSNNIAEIKRVASLLHALSETYEVDLFKVYAEELYAAVDAFDIGKMGQLLHEYTRLEEKMASL